MGFMRIIRIFLPHNLQLECPSRFYVLFMLYISIFIILGSDGVSGGQTFLNRHKLDPRLLLDETLKENTRNKQIFVLETEECYFLVNLCST